MWVSGRHIKCSTLVSLPLCVFSGTTITTVVRDCNISIPLEAADRARITNHCVLSIIHLRGLLYKSTPRFVRVSRRSATPVTSPSVKRSVPRHLRLTLRHGSNPLLRVSAGLRLLRVSPSPLLWLLHRVGWIKSRRHCCHHLIHHCRGRSVVTAIVAVCYNSKRCRRALIV